MNYETVPPDSLFYQGKLKFDKHSKLALYYCELDIDFYMLKFLTVVEKDLESKLFSKC